MRTSFIYEKLLGNSRVQKYAFMREYMKLKIKSKFKLRDAALYFIKKL